MLRNLIYLFTIGIVLSAVNTAYSATLTTTRGKLASVISNVSPDETYLKISGEIDARDFEALRSLPHTLKELDISNLNIKKCTLASPSPEGRCEYADGELPSYLFINSLITKVNLPGNLIEIPEGLFASSSLQSLIVPNNCTSIGAYAFYNCTSLENITLPPSITHIFSGAFYGCSTLHQIDLPVGVAIAGENIFKGSGIQSLDISHADFVGDYSLNGIKGLKEITLNPDAEYGKGVLMGNDNIYYFHGAPEKLSALFLANSNQPALSEGLRGVSHIGPYAFAGTNVEGIVLSKGLQYLSDGIFMNCVNLADIDANALGAMIPEVSENSFDGIDPQRINLYVEGNCFDLWKNHPRWGNFNIIAGKSIVNSPQDKTDISIFMDQDYVTILASETVGEYIISSLSGHIIASGETPLKELRIDISGNNEKIIIVRASNPTGEYQTTFIR